MGRQSSIKQLAPDILERLHELLRDPRVNQLEATARINAILEERGEDPVSKSAVNRYKLSFDEIGESMRESREIAAMFVDKFGAAAQTDIALMTSESIRDVIFRLIIAVKQLMKQMFDKSMDPDADFDDKQLAKLIGMTKELSVAQEKLEKAVSDTTNRDTKIKEQARKEALEEAASNAEEAARAQGLDEAQVDFWRNKVLGV
ncbi:phage protein Gp27 family protein [Oceanobacter mangrovi]|uniref:phage protein Gp27 family protein n=1 Tax=Oceanobacter mangrovi TaxID=2862510 RepID=UPI001C8DAE9C|nr:phage protein Gp27 family protein [Oceanobacter mangrovi]